MVTLYSILFSCYLSLRCTINVIVILCCVYLTQAPPPETKVNLHFVSIVQKDGHLYELGGEHTVVLAG